MFQFRKGLWYNEKVKSRMGKSWIARTLFLGNIFLCFGFLFVGSVSALSYQQDIGVNFTFNKVLSLTLSSNDIHITNLAPGTASDSNVININVLTNSVNGYSLTATVGNSTTYNTTNLVHSNSNINEVFTSIDWAANPTISSNTNLGTDKWGFSFSLDNGNSWSNYNGLPLYFGDRKPAILKQTNGPVSSTSGDNIKFKIGAKASSSKPAGDYSNIINFYVVAYPAPATLFDAFEAAGAEQLYGYYQMQDMTSSICSAVEADESELQVIDNRDNKVYWIAKLADGNCWMTQNLDLDIDSTKTYTHADTDLGWGNTINSSATWTPTRSTNNVPWCSGGTWFSQDRYCENTTPESYDPGELIWNTVQSNGSDWSSYKFNCDFTASIPTCPGTNPLSTYTSSTGSTHYHLGNLYNWNAAVAMNDTSSYVTSGETINQSICPAGWTLPKAYSYYDSGIDDYVIESDFYTLWDTYGCYSDSGDCIDNVLIPEPLYFTMGGEYDRLLTSVGHVSFYWSSTVGNGVEYAAAGWFGGQDHMIGYANGYNFRGKGSSVRCLAR